MYSIHVAVWRPVAARGKRSDPRAAGHGRGRRAGLSRQVVADAALDLVDEVGLHGFSMRTLAARLGVSPMALYNHVTSRAELLGLVVDRLGEEMQSRAPAGGTGLERVPPIARSIRSTYLGHPAAIVLVQTTTSTSAAALGPVEDALAAFVEAGMDLRRARSAWVGLIALVTGHVSYELNGHFTEPVSADSVPGGLTHLREVVQLAPLDHEEAFEEALTAFLSGLPRLPVDGTGPEPGRR